MTRMLKRAFEEAGQVPEEVQNTLAALLLTELETLKAATDSFLAVHRDAPVDDEPVTDEDLVALREGLEDLASGRTLSQEEILQRFAGKN